MLEKWQGGDMVKRAPVGAVFYGVGDQVDEISGGFRILNEFSQGFVHSEVGKKGIYVSYPCYYSLLLK